jgi:hypothetical protein
MIPKGVKRFSDRIVGNHTTRRRFLGLLASAPFLAIGERGDAREAVIPQLMKQAHSHERISQRIDFISRALLGAPYQGRTLIGAPDRKEILVTRDDVFDCITYCEAVLAAAVARNYSEYADVLKRIRYAHGEVRWAERNHDFAQWSLSNLENKICQAGSITPSVMLDKKLDGSELGKRHYELPAIATSRLIANQKALQVGDIVGFVSRRPDLDYFHTGFIAFNKGALMLRHASRTQGKVMDEDMASFVFRTGAQYVTLLRPAEPVSQT